MLIVMQFRVRRARIMHDHLAASRLSCSMHACDRSPLQLHQLRQRRTSHSVLELRVGWYNVCRVVVTIYHAMYALIGFDLEGRC